jgi:hypothetical protein
MRLMRSILKTIVVVGICLTTWLMVNISGLIISEQANDNIEFVPANSTFALRIDGRELAENTLFSIILESKDEDILKLFEESIKKRTSGEKEFTNTGINYLSDVILFKIPYGKTELTGILFNLLNRTTFQKNLPGLLDEDQVVASNGNVGLILSSDVSSDERLDKKMLRKYAEKLLKSKNKGHHQIFHSGSAPNRFSEIHFHSSDKLNDESEVNLLFEQDEQAFELKGKLSSQNKIKVNYLSHELDAEGLHITSKLFSDAWADTLQSSLSFLSKKYRLLPLFR